MAVRQEALDWFEEGKEDLQREHRSLDAEDYSWSCFAAHQAIEKMLKALIIGVRRRTPPRGNDLTELFREAADMGLRAAEADLSDISRYYMTTRYPNAGFHRPSRSFTRPQAERAIQAAEELLDDAERLLTPTPACTAPPKVEQGIESFLQRLAEAHPNARAYLYGSFARGDWLEDSDVDMVVVSPDFTGDPLFQRMSRLRLMAPRNVAFEILAYTPEEMDQKLQGSLIWQEIASYWKELTKIR